LAWPHRPCVLGQPPVGGRGTRQQHRQPHLDVECNGGR
jgi:hypothetical protein